MPVVAKRYGLAKAGVQHLVRVVVRDVLQPPGQELGVARRDAPHALLDAGKRHEVADLVVAHCLDQGTAHDPPLGVADQVVAVVPSRHVAEDRRDVGDLGPDREEADSVAEHVERVQLLPGVRLVEVGDQRVEVFGPTVDTVHEHYGCVRIGALGERRRGNGRRRQAHHNGNGRLLEVANEHTV